VHTLYLDMRHDHSPDDILVEQQSTKTIAENRLNYGGVVLDDTFAAGSDASGTWIFHGTVMSQSFQRAPSTEAKEQREAARALAAAHGVRQITLTDIADAICLHKSALLRYFETRERIFLVLTGKGWSEWSSALRKELAQLVEGSPAAVAVVFAQMLTARPLAAW
jgi:Bacterial regulatory proteins, tetR family